MSRNRLSDVPWTTARIDRSGIHGVAEYVQGRNDEKEGTCARVKCIRRLAVRPVSWNAG
jgi:hypothetical protein